MAITNENIEIISSWEIQTIDSIIVKKSLNYHAELCIKAVLTDESGKNAGFKETKDDSIKVLINDNGEKRWLFKGILKEVDVENEGGLYILTAYFLSLTFALDTRKKSRSFQDIRLTYNDIVTKVLEEYPGKSFEMTADKVPINGPLIQYQETDWQFIQRIASYQDAVIVPDAILDDVLFSFGYPSGRVIELQDMTYSSGKNIEAYDNDKLFNFELFENEYTYYEIETFDELTIGNQVKFHNFELYVQELSIVLENGFLVYKAKLVRKVTLRQNPIYNKQIKGISLTGQVLALQDQSVKLHLDIDMDQNEESAYWYPFVPPTTDMMYLMPQIGTIASLYIPGVREQSAIITGSVRTNGAICNKTRNPNNRYLGTEYGREMKMSPSGIFITSGQNNLVANFDDKEGVILSSHEKMIFNAKEEIVFNSDQNIHFNAASQILMFTPGPVGLSIENEIHFLADKVFIDCKDSTLFTELEEKQKEEDCLKITTEDIGNMVRLATGAIAKRSDGFKYNLFDSNSLK